MKNKTRANRITKYLADEDKFLFLEELLEAIEKSKRENNFTSINDCLNSWEATAELNSIPGLKERVWQRYNRIKKVGFIYG
jgi:hypothetical protein